MTPVQPTASARAAVAEKRDIVFFTLDSLRFDVAARVHEEGGSPNLARITGTKGWERRHAPATFTYASHQAFFAGFLPTPVDDPMAARLFALRFDGSRSIGPQTVVFDAADIVTGFRTCGHHTICIGGVGFFNKRTPVSRVLPGLFDESHWSAETGVSAPHSARRQVACAVEALGRVSEPVFLFINFSATHKPTCMHLAGAKEDSPATQAAALRVLDAALPPLFEALGRRGACFIMAMSDHGEAFGEDGYFGHRLAHQTVFDVPFAAADIRL